jgi:hypothetical protein
VARVIICCIFFHYVLLLDWNCANVCRMCAGLTALMALNILKSIDMRGLVHNSADYLHVLIEVLPRYIRKQSLVEIWCLLRKQALSRMNIYASLAVTVRILVCFFPSA